MEEWKEYKLGEITNMKNGKKRPHNNGVFPVYGGNGIMDYSDTYNAENAIIVGRVGAYCGCVYKCDGKCWVSDNAISVSAKEIVDIHFLYYLMTSLDFHHHHIGGAQPLMTQDIIGDFTVSIPPMPVQHQIVQILKSLDDKIEMNRRINDNFYYQKLLEIIYIWMITSLINDNLEQQAQALYNSWFVDFEPFRGKEIIENEFGEIPQCLSTTYISEIPHTLETGRRPKGGVGELKSGIPSVGAEHVKGMGNYDYSKTKYITEAYASTLKTGKVNGYELLIYKDGGKPGYFIPNYSIFGEGYPFDDCYLNEHVFKLDFGNKGYNAFCYFFFKTDVVMNYLNAQGGKAAIPGINRQDIENILIYSPQNDSVKEFGKLVLPMIKKVLINCKESHRIAVLRDILLLKLMSGELNVEKVNV